MDWTISVLNAIYERGDRKTGDDNHVTMHRRIIPGIYCPVNTHILLHVTVTGYDQECDECLYLRIYSRSNMCGFDYTYTVKRI